MSLVYMGGVYGDCQNYGPFLGPYYNTGPNTGPSLGDPKGDHNFDNPPYDNDFKLWSPHLDSQYLSTYTCAKMETLHRLSTSPKIKNSPRWVVIRWVPLKEAYRNLI